MPLSAGTRLGPYEILEPIGSGGMGEVYRGRDTRLDRTVAIKVLSADVIHDAERRRRFVHEARAASSLNHPNIVTLHDIGSEGGVDFLVMEYVRETPLDRLISSKPLPPAEVLECGIQIANALAAAHGAGLIHRDIKPANVMVTPQGQVKVLDFGLAKWPDSGTIGPDSPTQVTKSSLTQAGQVMGTVAYMSPEQARGERLDARTDLFSFGAVLYEMATGRAAFSKAFDWTPQPANGINPLLYRIILKLLEADRVKRYAKAADVAGDLKRLQQELQSSQSKRRRRLIFALALGAVALLAIAFIRYRPTPLPSQNQWVQLTNFPDSVTQPALSTDGRMLAFVRGPDTFVTPGQIYVRILPEGEPVQLTRDGVSKMSPVFSPDGSRIAYTVADKGNWDTWVVPVLSGQPRLWLANASGLAWLDKQNLLFSEIKKDIHMAIVASEENRAQTRDVYVPPGDRGMAHRSYPSPDHKWALVVEMDRSQWLPCRLVSLDTPSVNRQVGPAKAPCTFAAWSPDGRWMYLSSSAGGTFHIWRERFSDHALDQITSGLAEEEGIAVAPDGRRIVAATLDRQGKHHLWLAALDRQSPPRQIPNIEGDMPFFGPDGEIVFRAIESTTSAFAYRVSQDGTGLQKVIEQPIAGLTGISPDREWLMAKIPGDASVYTALPVRGGRPIPVIKSGSGDSHFSWSENQIYITMEDPGNITGRTYMIPLLRGQTFPPSPAGGFQSEAELSRIPGVRIVDARDAVPGAAPDIYAFSRVSTQRNLYRIPIP